MALTGEWDWGQETQPTWARWFAMRGVAAAVPCGLALVALLESSLIGMAGRHLCGWPATISCAFGVPLAWSVLGWVLWGFVIVAAVDVMRFLARPEAGAANRIVVWAAWGPATVVMTIVAAQDRVIDGGDLLIGMVILLTGLALSERMLAFRLPVRLALLRWLLIGPLAVAALTVPLWAPVALSDAREAEPSREDALRRRQSEQCIAGMDEPRPPSTEPQPACEVWPLPDDGVTPPG